MKRFLGNIFLYTTITGIFVLSLLLLSRYYVQQHADFRLPKSKHVLVIGDSHPECAINDTILSAYYNCAHSATHYVMWDFLIEHILAQNPQIDTVIIGVREDCFGGGGNRLADVSFLDNRKKVFVFASLPNLLQYSLKQPHYMRVILHTLYLPSVTMKDVGGYFYLERRLDEHQKRPENTPTEIVEPLTTKIPHRNIYYLQELLTKIRSYNKTIILMDCPVVSEWSKSERRAEMYNVLRNYHDTILLADYHDFQLPDSCFSDSTHLNHYGAETFSTHIHNNGLQVDTLYPY